MDLSDYGSIATGTRAPFARLAVSSEANRPQNVSASIAVFRDVHAMLRQKGAALFFSELHGKPRPRGSVCTLDIRQPAASRLLARFAAMGQLVRRFEHDGQVIPV